MSGELASSVRDWRIGDVMDISFKGAMVSVRRLPWSRFDGMLRVIDLPPSYDIDAPSLPGLASKLDFIIYITKVPQQ